METKLTSNTEVHVFLGKVDVVPGDQLVQEPYPKSQIPNPKSQIISAGQAITISANKIEPLPAADPFKFSPEAFDGRARETLLTDDFEALLLTASGHTFGQWKTAYASAEEIHVIDPLADAADVAATSPPVGHRAMEIRSDRRKTKNLNPFMAAKVDRPKVPADCRLLIEFDICPRTPDIEPSIQISGKWPLRLAPSIELAREPDPQAPQVSWQVHQWYRVRVVRNIVADVLREATFERQVWRGAEGWVRDLAIGLPAPKEQDHYSGQVWLGFPAPLVGQRGGTFWLDNVRMEVLGEK